MRRYLHFALALLGALAVGMLAAAGLAFAVVGFDDRVTTGDVMEITGWGGAAAAVTFWALGRWHPLAAPPERIIPCAVAAWIALIVLARIAAQTVVLSDTAAVAIWLAAALTLGWLPFRRPPSR